MDWGLLLVLLLAIAAGFGLGRRSVRVEDPVDPPALEPHYLQGLNYLRAAGRSHRRLYWRA